MLIKNKRINLLLKSDKKKKKFIDENKIDSNILKHYNQIVQQIRHFLKHYTNDKI